MTIWHDEKLLFELDRPGRNGVDLPAPEVPEADAENLLGHLARRNAPEMLPELSEVDVVRHFTRLSQMNYGLDSGFYPLGSCTMKYNPKVNEEAAALAGFAEAHPLQPETMSQGALEVIGALQEALCRITGMDACTLQPAAGAQGEFTGMRLIRTALDDRGDERRIVLIPDSAHGTNPASAHLAGFEIEDIKSGSDGCLDLAVLDERLGPDVAGMMLTVPNTLGIFEKNIKTICRMVHEAGGMVYLDGANLNAMMGITRPGDWGADVMHLNLHKTFSTPHGGGGPGAGPVICKAHLESYLPRPVLVGKAGEKRWDFDRPKSMGKVNAFYGNFLVLVRALAYIETMGAEGLREASRLAVLNANYVKSRLMDVLKLGYEGATLHEAVFCDAGLPNGVTTLDVAKRLIDYGFHPPTIYFPLIVHGAMMIEPTETEPIDEMDRFIEAIKAIVEEAAIDPEKVKTAPHTACRRRLDEVSAARHPILTYRQG